VRRHSQKMNAGVIGARNPSLLGVPPGAFHDWVSLEDDTKLVSTASEAYNRQNPDEIRVSRTLSGMCGR